MHIRRPVPALLLAAALGGCLSEREPLAPAVTAPALSLSAADVAAEQHLVAFRGKGVPATFAAQVADLGGSVLYTHAGTGLALVTGVDAAGAAGLRAIKGVADVQADAAVALNSPAKAPHTLADFTPLGHVHPATAPLAPWQWNMFAINADEAWDAGRHGSAEVTVAILDSGIDYDNPDLNGLVDLSRSASFVASDDSITATYFPTRHLVSDYNGHGTNVASQVSSNAAIFAGVTSHTTLMAVKVLGAEGTGSLGGVLFGMLWAADNGADVINMSLGAYRLKAGGGGQLQGILNSVFSYVKQSGALVVVAAGNESVDLDRGLFPDPEGGEIYHLPSLEADYCTATHVICVSSVGPVTAGGSPDIPSIFTNYGRSAVDVAAPGGNVGDEPSAWPWGPGRLSWVWSLCSKTTLVFDDEGEILGLACPPSLGLFVNAAVGTSQAAPHVAALAALLVAERDAGPAQLKAAIRSSAVNPGGNGNDPHFGKGRIDVARALAAW